MPVPVDAAPPAPLRDAAVAVFGDRLPLAERYAELLMTDGVVRGLIGPREAPRLWERHLLNSAVVGELIAAGASVVDVGSGAGLPGIPLAIARPDLTVILLEPLARRTVFLEEVVTALALDTVTVLRGRAEESAGLSPFPVDVVTSRAVAPLDRLAKWCLPLAVAGGRMLALKGSTVAEEIEEHAATVARLGGGVPVVRLCGEGRLAEATTVVEVVRERIVGGKPAGRSARREGRADKRGARRG
ncbi:16S rRNA (guanine(527)-N(7))-methyltransferase RsmG [Luedemannella helvata]|uniref:Ribosomal RNA small subunit methyltransferase G n=1 Tax=Luedemannella helvata TaxID=349315 RepID=A0ABP4XAR4_9ACTN